MFFTAACNFIRLSFQYFSVKIISYLFKKPVFLYWFCKKHDQKKKAILILARNLEILKKK